MRTSMPGCLQYLTSLFWVKNCNLIPEPAPVLGPRKEVNYWDLPPARQSLVQHLTDVIWRAPGFQEVLATLAVIALAVVMVRSFGYWRFRVHAGEMLPEAPSKEEHYSYFRGQWRRSLTVAFMLLSGGGIYGLWEVFTKSRTWYPFLVSLVILIPWTLYMIAVTLRRPSISSKTHEALPGFGENASVDVFIPVCGEDRLVVENTFMHVRDLLWLGELSIYVLDDSKDESLQEVSESYGYTYLRRPDRPVNKKSGNLNYALTQSSGDYIAVFDADFAPAPEFLTEVIPYFGEPDVGIVQTSQYFSISRRGTANWIARLSGVVQGMFFCWSQPGQQSKDAAICVGTNVIYSRTALDIIGGIPPCPMGGEDVITSVAMLAEGYRTVYVPLNLARGLCPDTFAAAVAQQYRWCLTTIALMIPVRHTERADKDFWRCKMTLVQRASYLAGLLYYAQSLLTLVISVLPALIMLWIYPYEVGPGNYLPIAPAMLSMLTLPLMIPGWRPEMLRLSLVYAVAHLLATADAVTGHVQGWVPTGAKGAKKNRRPVYAGIILRTWVIVTQGLAWWALARDVPVYGMPAYWIPVALTVMQGVVFLPLLFPGYGTVPLFRRPPGKHRKLELQEKELALT